MLTHNHNRTKTTVIRRRRVRLRLRRQARHQIKKVFRRSSFLNRHGLDRQVAQRRTPAVLQSGAFPASGARAKTGRRRVPPPQRPQPQQQLLGRLIPPTTEPQVDKAAASSSRTKASGRLEQFRRRIFRFLRTRFRRSLSEINKLIPPTKPLRMIRPSGRFRKLPASPKTS